VVFAVADGARLTDLVRYFFVPLTTATMTITTTMRTISPRPMTISIRPTAQLRLTCCA
jgi:hypothetical protein